MIGVLAAGAGGLVAGVVLLASTRDLLGHPSLQRENYRGHGLPTAIGTLLVAAVIAVEGARTIGWLAGIGDAATSGPRFLLLAAVVSFGFLGLVDDLLGDGRDRGLRGHVGAALRGRVTTGFLKLAGGAAVALVLAAWSGGSRSEVLVDGALIALAANLGNLLDRAPGRTIKYGLIGAVPVVVAAGTTAVGVALAPLLGAAVGFLPGDVRERYMLGDAGANALGAGLGMAVVLSTSTGTRAAVVGGLVVLTLASELVSFSRVIEAVAPLRAFDRLGRLAVVLLVLLGTAVAATGAAAAQTPGPRRLLIYSMPGFTWAESDRSELPLLDDFLADAAIADLAPRSVAFRSGPGEAYLTISAGTRATSDELIEGQVLGLQEGSGRSPAGEIFRRRTGIEPDGAYVALGWPELVRENDDEPYDAVLGQLGSTLDDEGVETAVVGNADGTDSLGTSYQRQVGLALADTDGVVAAGDLRANLLVADPSRPFGYRLDTDAVRDSFTEAWGDGSSEQGRVVLVEASDLARTMRYRPLVDAARYDDLRQQALADADALFGELLAEVDPERDAVMVIAPYNQAGINGLTVVALRTPTTEPGYLKSASTQRAGIVTLVDVAPTVLETLGIARPVEMEGREFEVSRSTASLGQRRDRLVSIDDGSRFRERLLFPTTLALVLVLTGVAALAAVVIAGEWSDRARRAVRFAALANLAGLPMSYVARAFPLEDLGSGFYWTFLVATSLAVAVAATVVAGRTGQPRGALTAVLALVLVVLVVDVTTGSNLHLSAAFGYSPTGNSRLYGISNYSFGQLAAATCLLAAIVAATWRTTGGRVAAIGLMGAMLVVLGVPTWGSDVGGVLAFTPTILVFVALLVRYRVRLRSLVAAALLTVAAVTAFGFLDLARPPGERAHLGRLFERIGNEGLEPLLSIVQRKFLANVRVSTSSFWVAAIPIGIAFWLFLSRYPGRPLARLKERIPTLQAGLVAAVVAAVLGSLLNDSGAIVGGVTVMVVTAALAYLAVEPA